MGLPLFSTPGRHSACQCVRVSISAPETASGDVSYPARLPDVTYPGQHVGLFYFDSRQRSHPRCRSAVLQSRHINWRCAVWDLLIFFGVVIAITVGGGFWWRYLTRPRLTEERYQKIAHAFLSDLRITAPDRDESVQITPADWHFYGVTTLEAIELARRMVDRGQIRTPGYTLWDILMANLPRSVAMTRNSYDRYGPHAQPVTVYGPAQFGDGTQMNSGTFTYSFEQTVADLNSLAFKLYGEARLAEGAFAVELEQAAEAISESVTARDITSAELKTTLQWLADFASNTSAGVVSAGIISAATALLSVIQWGH